MIRPTNFYVNIKFLCGFKLNERMQTFKVQNLRLSQDHTETNSQMYQQEKALLNMYFVYK